MEAAPSSVNFITRGVSTFDGFFEKLIFGKKNPKFPRFEPKRRLLAFVLTFALKNVNIT